MRTYLRNYVPGGTYFLTVATYRRRPILTTPTGRRILRQAFRKVRTAWPFEVIAIVLCPDHFHSVWALPEHDWDYSQRMQKLKEYFTKRSVALGGKAGFSRRARGQRDVWQPRFWEHTCRDEDDLKRCVDYVHWNPVKHDLVSRVIDYPWSSFHRYLALGEYPADWGGENPCPAWEGGE